MGKSQNKRRIRVSSGKKLKGNLAALARGRAVARKNKIINKYVQPVLLECLERAFSIVAPDSELAEIIPKIEEYNYKYESTTEYSGTMETENELNPLVETETISSPLMETEKISSPVAETEQVSSPLAETKEDPTAVVETEKEASPRSEKNEEVAEKSPETIDKDNVESNCDDTVQGSSATDDVNVEQSNEASKEQLPEIPESVNTEDTNEPDKCNTDEPVQNQEYDKQSNGNTEQENDDSNPIFEHVNTEKDATSKTTTVQEEEFQNSQPEEDPIAADACEDEDTELCIIPDTEREERDAAADGESNHSDSVLGFDFVISECTDDSLHSCIQCLLPRKCKYTWTTSLRTLYICDDTCLSSFKEENPGKATTGDIRVKNPTAEAESSSVMVNFVRKCVSCDKKIQNEEANLSWETMDFCNEFCLSKYQKKIGSNCSNCSVEVGANCLGKYCVRFGYDIRQFCSSGCLEEYKKGLKVCSYCQKDISGGGDGFLAPIGDKGQFKDFCTRECMEKYDLMSNHKKATVRPGVTCSVCLNEKPITIEYDHNDKMNLFCGEPCFVAFKFVNNIVPGKCDMCRRFFDNKVLEQNTMFYDDAQHSFCSKSCQNIYIIANRRIVPCSWCKVKKYNFDMIKRFCSSGQVLMMCSLNCLSLYQVSINAVNFKKTKCDHCTKSLQPMYHLTMSDATIRNFCSYTCVMAFQSQFAKTPITLGSDQEEGQSPVPTGGPKRTAKNSVEPESLTMPIISNVQSLAPTTNGSVSTRTARKGSLNASSSQPVKTQIKQQVIIKPVPMPAQRNVATMCKAVQATKSTSFRPVTVCKEIQTDDEKTKTVLIPVPVPIYVPSPLPMYSLPFPVPVPFVLPVPIPVFIPTTRNSASGIMKEIKKIQVKIPTDPFEAELLMMAEMVADDKKEEHTDSESEEDEAGGNAPGGDEPSSFSPEPVDPTNTFGDDMLQMALKMATELDEPAVDLEGALTASTITAPQTAETNNTDDSQNMQQMIERQSFRGRKRAMRNSRQAVPTKRGRRMSSNVDMPILAPPQPPTPAEPLEKPDANMCLKYTFGVNAWKQWVTTKNAELEKSSRRVKLFKPEILQLTADELNYSLCLFVKEVRKPNGTEYAPDTIYYLCLGIQQYLFENGRIDNIFCDAYYEKFTDCLDEVARKFSVLYNDSHYIVTRVEEEHLWESKQLGAHSPHVLLSTLMFFNTKHFNLTTVDEHMQLSFSHIMKHWKRNPNQPGTAKTPGSRNVLLRFYPPQSALANARKKKVYEQQENEENPLRCPVKLYEFYLSKCPESVKTRNDVFYLQPERSCVPDSPVWYSTMPLGRDSLEKMLHRVKMVKEINVALLTS